MLKDLKLSYETATLTYSKILLSAIKASLNPQPPFLRSVLLRRKGWPSGFTCMGAAQVRGEN